MWIRPAKHISDVFSHPSRLRSMEELVVEALVPQLYKIMI